MDDRRSKRFKSPLKPQIVSWVVPVWLASVGVPDGKFAPVGDDLALIPAVEIVCANWPAVLNARVSITGGPLAYARGSVLEEQSRFA